MTITARFSGQCLVCGGHIAAGEQIEWKKGEGSKHAACAAGKPAPAAASPAASAKRATRRAAAPRQRREPPPEGPVFRNDKQPYMVGTVMAGLLPAKDIAECEARQSLAAVDVPGDPPKPSSEPRRRVALVVIYADRVSQDVADDNGYMGRYGAVVRLATATEAAELVAERQAALDAKHWARYAAAWGAIGAAARKAALRDLVYVEAIQIGDMPSPVKLAEYKDGGTLHRWYRGADGTIGHDSYSYDDGRFGVYMSVDAVLALARRELASGKRTVEQALRGQPYSALDRAILWAVSHP